MQLVRVFDVPRMRVHGGNYIWLGYSWTKVDFTPFTENSMFLNH